MKIFLKIGFLLAVAAMFAVGCNKNEDASSASAGNGGRKEIERLFKSCENFVKQAEKAAKSNNMTDLLKLSEKYMKLAEDVEKIEEYDDWTEEDAMKLLELTNRYTEAISNTSTDFDFGL